MDVGFLHQVVLALATVGALAADGVVPALLTDPDGRQWCRCAKGPLYVPGMGDRAATRSSVPIASPPIRHSRPGSSKVLYLDFDGGTVTGTAWNTRLGAATLDCRPLDRDGDATTFNDAEQAEIVRIWQRVCEDYRPFDIDVTTELPASFTTTTARAMITQPTDRNGVAILQSNEGGIAYVNAFGGSSYAFYSPAWIAADMEAEPIAEAVSHEIGHNLGLHHDGWPGPNADASEYYDGHAGGGVALSWGPIMGAAYGRTLSLWSKGEYFGANNTEDDLAIIAAKLGYVADDYGDQPTTASAAPVVANAIGAVAKTGVIGAPGDVDCFRFSVPVTGAISLSVSGYRDAGSPGGREGGDLDIKATLRNRAGTAIATANPPLSGEASIVQVVGAGTYFLSVEPAGAGSPLADPPTGYTTYGVFGAYTIAGSLPAGLPAVADAGVSGATGAFLAYDAGAGADSYAASGLPPGLVLDPATGAITGTPTADGVFIATVTGSNAAGNGSGLVTFTIAPPPPPVVADASASGTVGSAFSYTPTATDADSFAAADLPPGTAIDADTGVISGIPTLAGTYPTIITGTNASGSDSGTVVIAIAPEPLPNVSDGTGTGTTGTAFLLTVSATHASSFSAIDLPPGLAIHPTTGAISGTPSTAGVFTATVTGTNGSGSESGIYTITISSPTPAGPSVTDGGGGGGGGCGAGGGIAVILGLLGLSLIRRR